MHDIAQSPAIHTLLSKMPGVAYQLLMDRDGRLSFLFISESCHRLFGLSAEAIMTDSHCLLSRIHSRDRRAFHRSLQAAARNRSSWFWQGRFDGHQHQECWVYATSEPELLADGSILWHGTLMEVNSFKQAESRLKRSRKTVHKDRMRYRYALDSTSEAVALVDTEGQPIYHNGAFARLFQVDELSTLVAAGGMASLYAQPQTWQAIYDLARSDRSWVGEVTMKSTRGQMLTIFLRVSPIHDADGSYMGCVSLFSDVTLKRQADQERRQLAALVENSPNLIGITSLDGEVLYMNGAGLALVGLPNLLAAQNHQLMDFFAVEDRPIAAGLIHPIALRDGTWSGAFRLWNLQAQSYIPVDYTIFVIRHPQTNDPLCLGVIARDASDREAVEVALRESEMRLRQQAKDLEETISELRHTQAQLIQQEKMSSLGQLVAGVAHEINNPVNFIYGNLDHAKRYAIDLLDLILLCREYFDFEAIQPIAEHLEDIDFEYLSQDLPKLFTSMKMGADRIKAIIKSLRTFSRMDESELKEVNLHDDLESTLTILNHRLRGSDKHPPTQVIRNYGHLNLVECHPGQLNQVFINILANSLDALEDRYQVEGRNFQPQIVISTRPILDNHWVQISISDNGAGIPESIRAQLFDPFFTTKAVGRGTGLGLSISYQVVTERHHGRLLCESQEGLGSTFTIEIPTRQSSYPSRGPERRSTAIAHRSPQNGSATSSTPPIAASPSVLSTRPESSSD
ncbi:ATP-binding protein [Limnothrix sp. FACHB-881]|uniref:ATP-binding protein n=2 Tax=Limnothrix TaxID=132605 RepID=UPI00351C6648